MKCAVLEMPSARTCELWRNRSRASKPSRRVKHPSVWGPGFLSNWAFTFPRFVNRFSGLFNEFEWLFNEFECLFNEFEWLFNEFEGLLTKFEGFLDTFVLTTLVENPSNSHKTSQHRFKTLQTLPKTLKTGWKKHEKLKNPVG